MQTGGSSSFSGARLGSLTVFSALRSDAAGFRGAHRRRGIFPVSMTFTAAIIGIFPKASVSMPSNNKFAAAQSDIPK